MGPFHSVHRRRDFLSRLKWRNVITESFGHNCHYLAAIDNNGEWQGVLPLVHMRSRLFGHFLISVPFVNYGGLLCNNIRLQACCWMRQNGCGGLLGQLMLNCDTRGESYRDTEQAA